MRIDVIGLPAPQGSKRHVGNGVMVESSKRVKPWRQDVKYAALNVISLQMQIGPWEPLTCPISIKVFFYLPRPKGHYRTGANAHLLRESAPLLPSGRPDWDKLLRSTFDALGESGLWADDAQVTDVVGGKRYADGRQPGAVIDVQSANVQPEAAS